MVRSHGVSEPGAVRQTNEDCFLADDGLGLFVVADGIGGHVGGEVAARVAVTAIEDFIRRAQQEDGAWPCDIDPALSDAGNCVRAAIHVANRSVLEAAELDDRYAGMGTTVVCALIHDRRVAFGHVGDSRLYVYSRGVLEQQTRDDTWAATLMGANPGLDPSALASHPMRNVLTNVLGVQKLADIHVSERELRGGEMLLLCTDGVHGVVGAETLAELLEGAAERDLSAVAGAVVSAALERGSRDNLTALLVRYGGPNGNA